MYDNLCFLFDRIIFPMVEKNYLFYAKFLLGNCGEYNPMEKQLFEL